MVLNVNQKGEILFDGQPWLFAAFLAKRSAQLITPFEARVLPHPFSLEMPDGKTVWGQAGDFLLKGPEGYFIVPAAEFPKTYSLVQKVA